MQDFGGESSLSAGGLQYTDENDNDGEKQSHEGHQKEEWKLLAA